MKLIDYKSGAIVYFQSDVAEKIYLVQAGYVSLTSSNIKGEIMQEMISNGGFFGVKSSFGNYPREETATVISNSKIIVFSVPEFEAFCSTNTRILMKMLKVFSNQLRRLNKELLELNESPVPDADDGLYGIGEFFLKDEKYERAKYVLTRYLEDYPQGKNAANAAHNLKSLNRMLKIRTA